MNYRAFTLIEVLVVISILTLLSSIIFVNVQDSRAQARDAVKKQQAHEVQNALSMYHIANKGYPGNSETVYKEGDSGYDTVVGELVSEGVLSQVPTSPEGDAYTYAKISDKAGGVYFSVKLEKKGSEGPISSCGINLPYPIVKMGGHLQSSPPGNPNINFSGGEFRWTHPSATCKSPFDDLCSVWGGLVGIAEGYEPSTGEWDKLITGVAAGPLSAVATEITNNGDGTCDISYTHTGAPDENNVSCDYSGYINSIYNRLSLDFCKEANEYCVCSL